MAIISPVYFLGNLVNANWKYKDSFLDSTLLTLTHMSILMSVSPYLDSCSNQVRVKFHTYEVKAFQLCSFFFFKISLTVLDLSYFIIDFSISSLILEICWKFESDCIEFTDHFWNNCHLNSIEYPSPWTWNVFPFI